MLAWKLQRLGNGCLLELRAAGPNLPWVKSCSDLWRSLPGFHPFQVLCPEYKGWELLGGAGGHMCISLKISAQALYHGAGAMGAFP